MKNYDVTGERLLNERLYHLSEDISRDGSISLEEFIAAKTRDAQRWRPAMLVGVHPDRGAITIRTGGEGEREGRTLMIPVAPKAIIIAAGSETKLGELSAGKTVFLFMSHDNRSAIGVTQR